MPPKSRFAFNMLLNKLFKRKEPAVIHMDLETDVFTLWGEHTHAPAEFINVDNAYLNAGLLVNMAENPNQQIYRIQIGQVTPEQATEYIRTLMGEFTRVVQFKSPTGYKEENGLVFFDVQEELNLGDALSHNEVR